MNYKLIILVLCLAGAIAFTFLETSVSLQIDDCGYPPLLEEPPIGKRNTWAKNLPVNVFIAAAFSDDQENGIRDALSNWQSERTTNQSGVVFNIQVGSAPSNQTGSYCDIRAQAPPAGIPNATDRGAVSTAQGSTSLSNAFMYINPTVTLRAAVTEVTAHEIGHTFGLDDCPDCFAFDSVMANAPFGVNPNRTGRTDNPSNCDNRAVARLYSTPTPTPTPTPAPTPIPGGCLGLPDWGQYPTTGCAPGFQNYAGTCERSLAFQSQCSRFGGYDDEACGCFGGCEPGFPCSPIVVDVLGNGFDLTNAANGVNFDVDSNGTQERRSWTAFGSDDAWLAFDRNGDGFIDSGRELFGNVTPQEPPATGEEMNGFRALALYDGLGYGGNGDGKITQLDAIFDRLKLWQDTNHDGVSESCELFSLPDLGLRKLDLDYRESRRVDQYGNQFKYRAKVRDAQGAQVGRWAWDVFLVVEQP